MNSTNPAPGGTGQIDSTREELNRAQIASIQNEEKRREVAHARAMKSGIKTSEGIMTALVLIGAFAVPLGTVQVLFEQLAALHPAAPWLATAATLLAALHTAAKAVGAYAQSRAAVKTGLRMMALALVLGLTLTSASALASTSTILNPRPTLAGVPSVGDIVDIVPGVGLTCADGRGCELIGHLWGFVAVADVAPGWTLGPVLGGGVFLPKETGVPGAVSLGGGLQFPWGTSVRLGLLVTADYYLPTSDNPTPTWGASGSLGFFF